jgi:hypothetical protein
MYTKPRHFVKETVDESFVVERPVLVGSDCDKKIGEADAV